MSPLGIQIALTYCATANDFRDGDFSAPAVRELIDWFVEMGLLRLSEPKDHTNTIYVATDKCHAYVGKLCSIDLPKQVWTYDEN
jgi:hypothetical protein